VLHKTRNMVNPDNILRDGRRALERKLPPGWSASVTDAPRGSDAILSIRSPDRREGAIAIQTHARLTPKRAAQLADGGTTEGMPLAVFARYLSESTRARLRDLDVGYLDLTGNIRIILSKPGLVIETEGASVDPDRQQRPARTLRGSKAGRIVRILVDRKSPPGVREIAEAASVDAGYVSRVLTLLDSEALIARIGRGKIDSVDWPALLRRWATEAPLDSRGTEMTLLEPRGLSALLTKLASSSEQYVVTGELAAKAVAPVAPPRLATIWLRDASEAAKRLQLRPAAAGANVLAIEPSDDSVFDGATERDGIRHAALSQVAADLLTSPGRGPAEAEELIEWMLANEEVWRR
jgi:hypothetical protein